MNANDDSGMYLVIPCNQSLSARPWSGRCRCLGQHRQQIQTPSWQILLFLNREAVTKQLKD